MSAQFVRADDRAGELREFDVLILPGRAEMPRQMPMPFAAWDSCEGSISPCVYT